MEGALNRAKSITTPMTDRGAIHGLTQNAGSGLYIGFAALVECTRVFQADLWTEWLVLLSRTIETGAHDDEV